MKNVSLIIFSLLLLSSCQKNDSSVNHNYSDTIQININKISQSVDMSKILKKAEYLPLETLPESIIGSIDKLIVTSQYFYILDKQTLSLMVFDMEGKFIHKICQVGRGPQEYIDLNNFFIDHENDFIILKASSKFMYFDLNTYKFIKERKVDINCECIYLGNETFSYYLANNTWNGKCNIISQRNGHVIYEYLPISKDVAGFTYSKEYNFSQPTDDAYAYFVEMFKNVVYKLNSDSMIVAYNIDFGKNNLPVDFFENIPHETRTDRLLKSSYCHGIGDFIKNGHLNYFNFTYKEDIITYMNLYDKNEEFLFKAQNNDITFLGGMLPMLYCDSISIYTSLEMNEIKEGYSYIKSLFGNMDQIEKEAKKAGQVEIWNQYKDKIKLFNDIYYPTIESLAEKSEEDNPVLVRWYY